MQTGCDRTPRPRCSHDVHTPAVDGDHRDAATARVGVLESLGYPPAGSMKNDQRIHLYGVLNTD